MWTIAKHRFALPAERRVPAVIETAGWEFDEAVKILASHLDKQSYLIGGSFSVADILAAHTLLWAKSTRLPLIGSLSGYLERLLARPAVERARSTANTVALKDASGQPSLVARS